ncbi:cold-shock protein [Lacihabitans lacunae]|jgi:cold shock CspA family protein|uniref:Cold-shock protein n=1 Tax=Lacihabitans lacunae TaxID=1028214 RepID=A0ABV7YUU5_9BACT
MGRSQETFNKKEVRSKKEKKRKDKEQKRLEKKDMETTSKLEDMLIYVDEMGNLTETPPDPTQKRKVKLSDIEISVPKKDSLEEEDPTRKGVITHFNDSKGYGFIKDSENQNSVFFHVNNTLEEVKENNMVTFEIEMGPKGATGVKVKPIRS